MALDVRCFLDSLAVRSATPDALSAFPSKPTETIEPGHKVYVLLSHGWSGFIVGGIMRTHEDKGDFFSPSELLGGVDVQTG